MDQADLFMFLFSRESRRTSRSSTSSFKENISDNIPSQSNIVAEISKPVLRPINKENSRSPLSRRCNNIQSIPEIRSTPPKIEQPIIIAKKENTDNKSEKREELEFIKGKKCIKCGYSSVKVIRPFIWEPLITMRFYIS